MRSSSVRVALLCTLIASGCKGGAAKPGDAGLDVGAGGAGGGAAGSGGSGGNGGGDGAPDAPADHPIDTATDRFDATSGAGGTLDAGTDLGIDGAGGTNSLRDRFPPSRPATITVNGTITKNDVACVMVGTSGGCLAQNDPPCSPAGGQTAVTLQLTIDAQDNITVQAPYQDMCAPDYFCAISGPGCPIPTSYPVPLVNQRYLYDPRSTDRCRVDTSGTPIQVEHLVDVTTGGNGSLTIHQVCHTRMRNDGTTPSSYVNDTRDWTTVLTF